MSYYDNSPGQPTAGTASPRGPRSRSEPRLSLKACSALPDESAASGSLHRCGPAAPVGVGEQAPGRGRIAVDYPHVVCIRTGRTAMKKVIWGVLSTAKIGLKRVLPGMLKSDLLEIRAIASRSAGRGARSRRRARHPAGLRFLRGAAGGSGDRGRLQPAPQSPARSADPESGRGRQARAVREADRIDRRGGAAVAGGRGPRADHGSLHGALPPAMAARPRSGPPGPGGARCAWCRCCSRISTPIRQTSATWRTSAAGRCTTSAAIRSWRAASSSKPSPGAPSPWSIAIPPSAPIV